MKLPFRRSKSKVNLAATDMPSSPDLANTPSQFSTQSESPHSLLTPPRKSTVFGGYGDSGNALSTKSLPGVNHARSESHETVKTTVPASVGKKSAGGLFSWARGRKKSKAPPPPLPSQLKEESFDLCAFCHVSNPDTPPDLDDTAPLELPPARPRPRGDSVASDSSQRVSVAAFREMQARRSQASSPTPQPTSRSSIQIDGHLRSGSLILNPPAPSNSHSRPRSRSVAPRMAVRASTLRSPRPDSDSDSDHGPSPLSVQWRSKSELGHSSLPDRRSPDGTSVTTGPQLKHKSNVLRQGKKLPMPASVHAPARPAAIQSRSSSQQPAQNVPIPIKNTRACISYLPIPDSHMTTHPAATNPAKDSNTSDSSNSSDDDAPLATLVQPRRPGSSLSNASGRSLPPKPLIDIRSLSNSPLSNSSPVSVNPSPIVQSATPISLRIDVRSPTNINERLSNLTQGLTRLKPTSPVVPDPAVNASDSQVPPTTTGRTAPSRSITAPSAVVPSVEKQHPAPDALDRDTPLTPKSPAYSNLSDSAATIPSVNTTEFPPISGPRTSLSLDDPTPIKPTPIHHRVPQSGFSVMSRPHHHSTTSASISAVPSTNSSQKQVDGESPDSVGDFTAAMFSQLDLGLSPDESQGSMDNTITKAAITKKTAKSTVASSAVLHSQATPTPGPTTRTVNPVRQNESTPTRSILSDVSSTLSPISVSESMTSSPWIVGQPRSSTSVSSQSAQPPDDQPHLQTVSQSQPLKAVKNTTLGLPRPSSISQPLQSPPPR